MAEQTQPPVRKVALHLRDDGSCFWILSQAGAALTAAVQRRDVRSLPLYESCQDQGEADRRFAELRRGAVSHQWIAFYVGPPLQG